MNTSRQTVKTLEGVGFSIVKEGDNIWFWGSEVAGVLGYSQPRNAIIDHVKDYEKRKVQKAPHQNGAVLSNNKTIAF